MTYYVTPSSLWQGNPVAGSRWTREQISVLAKEGRDPASVDTATIMRMPRCNPNYWTMPPVAVAVVLPRLRLAKNGKALVVTPAGAKQWLEIARG